MIDNLQTTLRSLRLGGMAETLPVRCQEARANELDYEEFLRRLIDDELSKRKNTSSIVAWKPHAFLQQQPGKFRLLI